MTTIPAGYLPRHLDQFDGSRHQGGACGDISTRHALDWSTGGAICPGAPTIRKLLGTWVGQQATPPTDATSLGDQSRAWAGFRDEAREKGLRLGSYTRNLMKPWDDAIAALDAGYAIVVQFDHATWNDGPAASGDPAFRGFHVVFIPRLRRRNGRVELLDYDGMFDGRRKGIPQGPQWVPAWTMKKAAEEKVRKTLIADGMKPDDARKRAEGVAVFAVVTRSTPIVKPEPEPEPEPEPQPGDDDTIAWRELLAERDARITALEVALGTARTALLGLKNDGAIDAALADIAEALPIDDLADPDAVASIGVGKELP